ncbi:hypothetical protein [Streptomyces sp. S.PNR 29]|uniref:hypothetical protein n=1 Tax=Streptomyces sp. S.PNR 29 TaxID=2973805 RepID=UPI0025B1347B|nr:hypothetical protein [Streptomyces sp. S.PNR 29]MDN0199605.1 hypothetical protein [Streptomyces sp. S.PNR 29]
MLYQVEFTERAAAQRDALLEVAPGITVDYMVHRAFLILVSVAVLDRSLIDE